MALTKVIGAGLGEVKGASSADLTIDAPTDNATLTLKAGSSDSGAEGAFAVFIQNTTNKWQMGMNTDNSFRLYSYGASAEVLNMDSTGAMTKPLQPAFLVTKGSSQTNMAVGGAAVTITFDTEVFDQNADFASNTFTAPVTGRYLFSLMLNSKQLDTAASAYNFRMASSNRNYSTDLTPSVLAADSGDYPIRATILADMDANDTISVNFVADGAQQVDVGTASFFSGFLVA